MMNFELISMAACHYLISSLRDIYTIEYGLGRKIIMRRKITKEDCQCLKKSFQQPINIYSSSVDLTMGLGLNLIFQGQIGRYALTPIILRQTLILSIHQLNLVRTLKDRPCIQCERVAYACGSSLYGRLGLSETDQTFNNRFRQPALVTFPRIRRFRLQC